MRHANVSAAVHALAVDPDTVWVDAEGNETQKGSQTDGTTTVLTCGCAHLLSPGLWLRALAIPGSCAGLAANGCASPRPDGRRVDHAGARLVDPGERRSVGSMRVGRGMSGGAGDASGKVTGLKSAATGAAASQPIDWAARAGLTARGVVWIVIGILGVLLAQGARGKPVDQKGALQELLAKPYGSVLVVLMAIGFLGYALWRLSEAAIGVTGEGRKAGPRLQSLARGIAYLLLAGTAVSAFLGSGSSQTSQQQSWTARAMSYTGGRWLVALIGLVIVGVGVALVVQGWQLSFMRYFKAVPPQVRRLVVNLGRIGTIGRGAVFALVGVLVVSAAWTLDPKKAGGLDGALRTLLQHPYGTALALVASLALVAFGGYGLAEARYRRV